MGDVHFRSAVELAAAMATKKLSSREVLEQYLARIDKLNGDVNAVVALDTERALIRADEADQATARGESWGPLHGVPMTVKDSIETEGLTTACGAPALKAHVPERDGDAVASLKAAGAIVFGKTNTPMFAGDFQTYNAVYGVTSNPWDHGRTVGGSSGGPAAALAAGLTGFELGSDIGGSIRNPAHFCGVFGLKPTWGAVPGRGHIPGPPGALTRTDVASLGPMGRSAADLDLGLDVLAGPDPERAVAWRLQFPPPRHESLADYRLAAWLDDPLMPVDSAVLSVLNDTVAALRHAGATVDHVEPPVSMATGMELWERLVWPLMAGGLPAQRWAEACEIEDRPAAVGLEHADIRWGRASAIRHRDWAAVNEERARARAKWAAFFTRYDALLTPVMPVAAFPHDTARDGDERSLMVNGETRRYWDGIYWCSIFGAVHLPAASVPAGLSGGGLPVGIQVVGPYLEDRTVTGLAGHIETVRGGFRPPPGY